MPLFAVIRRIQWGGRAWLIGSFCALLIGAALYVTLTLHTPSHSSATPPMPGQLDANASVSNQLEQQVLQRIGTMKQITDVYLAKTVDGRLVVSATADLGEAPNGSTNTSDSNKSSRTSDGQTTADRMSVAMGIAKQFSLVVYAMEIPVAQSMINITDHGNYVAGAALGWKQAQVISAKHLRWSDPAGFVNWLESFQHEDSDLENNTFFYTESNLP